MRSAVAKGSDIGALSAFSLDFAPQLARTCNTLVSGYAMRYCPSIRKLAMAATQYSTGVARSTWNHRPAITLIVSSVPSCMATRRDSRRPFMRD